MRRKLQELDDTLGGFVDQRDNLTLVVASSDAETAWVLKTLQGLDQESESDLFLVFPQAAGPAPEYVTAVVASLEAQLEGANAVRVSKGEPSWPPLPAVCKDVRSLPPLRMRAAIEHVRRLMPQEGDHRLVWALMPLEVHDRVGYAQLVGHLLPRDGFEPWMRSLRIVVRDERQSPFLIPALRRVKSEGVLLYEPDMSTAALTDALAQDAEDPAVPPAERMQALMQLAALDYAYRRYPQALEKYGVLFSYYAEADAKQMQALCLQGVGDVLRCVGRPESAKERFQQGLALAVQTQALPIILNLAMAAGDVSLELGQAADAEGYFDIADRVAAKALNPYPKADALEKLGVARQLQRNVGGAMAAWRDAATLCRATEYAVRLRSVLERMHKTFKDAGMRQEAAQCAAELAAPPPAGKESHP